MPIGGKPIIGYIVDQLEEIASITDIYVVTNRKFVNNFEDWSKNTSFAKPLFVLDDGTLSEETRMGAIGDIQFVLEKAAIDEDVIIIAGDNYFTYSLKDYVDFYREANKDCVCVQKVEDQEAIKHLGVAVVNSDNIIVDLEEKPQNPKSDIAVYATYIYKKETLPLFRKYLEKGNKPDAPGYFVQWLYKQKPVAAYAYEGKCYDIGTHEAYKEAQELFDQ